jgi:hypothetical protein
MSDVCGPEPEYYTYNQYLGGNVESLDHSSWYLCKLRLPKAPLTSSQTIPSQQRTIRTFDTPVDNRSWWAALPYDNQLAIIVGIIALVLVITVMVGIYLNNKSKSGAHN